MSIVKILIFCYDIPVNTNNQQGGLNMEGIIYLIIIAVVALAAFLTIVFLLARRAKKSKNFEEDFGRVGTLNAINQWRHGR